MLRARGSFPCPVPRGAQVGGSSFPLGPTQPQDEAAAPVVPQIPRGDEAGGAPEPPVPSPGSFSAGSTALIIFNEDFQVLPGNYPQEAYCRAGVRTQHEQTALAMRWVIQSEIYISKSTSPQEGGCVRRVSPPALTAVLRSLPQSGRR